MPLSHAPTWQFGICTERTWGTFVWPEMIYIWTTLGASFVTESSPLCYPVDARDVDFGRIPYEKERACG